MTPKEMLMRAFLLAAAIALSLAPIAPAQARPPEVAGRWLQAAAAIHAAEAALHAHAAHHRHAAHADHYDEH